MHDCDVMINVGARFDDRVTGRINAFSPGSKKIHIDIDPSSINKNVRIDIPVIGDCAKVLEALIGELKAKHFAPDHAAHGKWWKQIETWRKRDSLHFDQDDKIIKPQYAIERLYAATRGRETFITTEVGNIRCGRPSSSSSSGRCIG